MATTVVATVTSVETPALPAPAGQISNFSNPPSLIQWGILCVSVCLSTTTVVILLRIYVRLVIKRQWIVEDYMCSLSWVGLVAYCSIIILTMVNKAGFHEWDLDRAEVEQAVFWLNAGSVAYGAVICCTKLSILVLYRRVFFPQRRSRSDLTICTFMLLLTCFYFSITFVKIWECIPRQRIWDQAVPGTCIDVSTLFNVSGLFNTITDFIILLIPVRAIWKLNMKRNRKLGVLAVFTVGMIAPVFSIVGFVVRIEVGASPDLTYNQLTISLWAAAEITTGLICVCLPELAALVSAQHRHLRRQRRSGGHAVVSPREETLYPRSRFSAHPRTRSSSKKRKAPPSSTTQDDERDLFEGPGGSGAAEYIELEGERGRWRGGNGSGSGSGSPCDARNGSMGIGEVMIPLSSSPPPLASELGLRNSPATQGQAQVVSAERVPQLDGPAEEENGDDQVLNIVKTVRIDQNIRGI